MKNIFRTKYRYALIPLGAIAGYLYYYYIGCNSGGCAIQSNPYFSTFYGALIGLIISLPSRKEKVKANGTEETNN